MSVDCNAYLPVTTEPSDIADAIAILLGAKVTMEPLDNYSDSVYAKVGGVEVDPSTMTFAYATLSINAALQRKAYELARGAGVVDADPSASLGLAPSLGLDVDRRAPALYVHLGSGPVRVAIAVRLAQFFGGSVVPQDSGAGKYEGKVLRFKRRAPRRAQSGKGWTAYQMALAALRPLSLADIKSYRKYAYHAKEG